MTGNFAQDLARWGPASAFDAPSHTDAETYCRRLAQTHYENFSVVSWLLPRPLRQHFYNVYAYCRWADDLADEVNDPQRSLELLEWWRHELQACYAGRVTHPVFVALLPTIREFEIPQQPFADLLSAFEQDQRVQEYETFEQLQVYCRRSANPVGRLVLYLCQAVSDENFAWSDSICTGLQLANFWQDVARDFEFGRIYLPADDRQRFSYSREQLDRRVTNPAFVELMRFEVDRARGFLQAGLPLVGRLPFRLQVDVDLFVRGGLKILERIERVDFRVWDVRPTVTKFDAGRMFLGSISRAVIRASRSGDSGQTASSRAATLVAESSTQRSSTP